MSVENTAYVQNYYKKLYSPAFAEAITEYLSDDYVEHQYTTGFTKTGLRDYVQNRLLQNPQHQVIIHRVIRENNLVFLFVEEKLANGVDIARAELFRLSGGKIAEHWGSHVVDEKNRKNSNGTFDGPHPDRAVDYASQYLDEFEALDLRGFDGQEVETFYESRTPEYRQHSPKGGDGVEGLVSILRQMKNSGIKMIMEPKRVIVDGDFLVCHRLYNSFPPHPLANRINTFDVFRFNADGKAVEHWDVMEDVPEEAMLAKIF